LLCLAQRFAIFGLFANIQRRCRADLKGIVISFTTLTARRVAGRMLTGNSKPPGWLLEPMCRGVHLRRCEIMI
jgi:hypothetical protein